MTRQQAIAQWAEIVKVVFCAEENIAKEWNEKVNAATSLPKEEQITFINNYCEAIATEIMSATSDEQIKEMKYGEE